MLTYGRNAHRRLRQVADAGLFALAWLLAYHLRARLVDFLPGIHILESFGQYLWIMPIAAVLGPWVLASQGFYEPPRPGARLAGLFVVLRSCALTVVGLILLLFFTREQLARSVIVLAGGIGGILVYTRHELTRWLDSRDATRSQRRALWVGTALENNLLRSTLTRAEKAGLEEAGEFDPAAQPLAGFIRQLHEQSINVVILNLAGVEREQAGRVLLACAHEGVEVLVRMGLTTLPSPHVTMDQFGGESVLYYRAQAAAPGQLLAKRLFDYAAAALLLVVLAPLFVLVAFGVKATSPGSVIYRQLRAGLNGRPFTMFKFRSMTADADQKRGELAARNEMRGPVFKVRDDPRVTTFGRFIRRHSLDELPQVWNVLRGEMSLVGPRPLPIEEVKRFDDDAHRRRLSVRPGLTCLWQISGRNDIDEFTDWVRLDLAYIDQWSLWLDLKILLATIPVAILGKGGR